MRKELFALLLVMVVGASAQAAIGNMALRDAVNAALAEVFSNNEMLPIAQAFPVGVHTQNCPVSTDYFPYPATPTSGTLYNILNSGTITLSISYSFPPVSFVNSSGSLDGFEVRLFQRVVQRIGLHYSKTIAITWYNADGKSFWGPIETGAVDAFIGAIIPGQYNATARITTSQIGNLACSHMTNEVALQAGPSFTGTLSIASINSQSIKIGSYSTSDTVRTEINNRAPQSTILNSAFYAPSYELLFQWLANGTVDVIAAYSTSLNYNPYANSSYQSLNLGVQFMKAFVTRRDNGQTPASDRVTAVDGNEQMLFAFQAFLANYYNSGSWATASATYGLGARLQNCVPNPAWYPYPSTANLLPGALQNVLNSRKLNMCYVSATPFIYSNGGGMTGYYYDLINAFATSLQAQYSGAAISTSFTLAVETPTFNSVYNGSCHGFVGAIIPGSLGATPTGFTTTAQRLYQSCSIHADAVVIVAGPAYTGSTALDALNSPDVVINSLQSSTSARNYIKTLIPRVTFNITNQSQDQAFADLAAGRSKLTIAQIISAKSFIGSNSGYTIISLYDQLLYGVAFYKPAPPTITTTTATSSASSLSAGFLALFVILAAFF